MSELQKVLFWIGVLYYLAINIVLYVTMAIDKKHAIKNKRRIPEKTLFLMALLGGGVGGFLAMFQKHHKTKHTSFYFVFGLTIVLHLAWIWFCMTQIIF